MQPHRGWVVAALGTAQTLSWAASYYLPAMLATPMAADLGIGAPTVFAAFSMAMGVSALMGPWSGRLIDRHGGRPVLMATNGVFIAGLLALAACTNTWTLFAAWAVMGLAMGSGLYEAAFASLVRLYGHGARNPITGITLIAGFASTVGWPLSAWMASRYGWRGACVGWALLQLLVALPLNASLPRPPPTPPLDEPAAPPATPAESAVSAAPNVASAVSPAATSVATPAGGASTRWAAVALALVFATTWFVSTAMASHLPRLLEATGASLAVAVGVGALIGPAQVAGRLLEFGFLRRTHPLLSARLATLGHPLGAAALLVAGPVAAPAFAVLHGLGNGILTIAKGTLPLAFFGPLGYGALQGWLMLPARIAQAVAPFAFGLALDAWGAGVLWLSMALVLAAFALLMTLHVHSVAAPGVAAARRARAP